MTVVRGAAARRLAVRTHALHLRGSQPLPGRLAPSLRATDATPRVVTADPDRTADRGAGRAWSAVLPVAAGTGLRPMRAFIGSRLREHGLNDRQHDATLVATELVTNALLHTSASTVTLRLSNPPAGVLLVEVSDPDPTCPALSARASAATATTGGAGAGRLTDKVDSKSGRGLDIVGALSRWGVQEHPSGKTVWALLEQDLCQHSDHDTCAVPAQPSPPAGSPPAGSPPAGNPAAGSLGRASADSRPPHLGAVLWTLASSARQLGDAAGLPAVQRQELTELLHVWHDNTDTNTDQVVRRVTSVTAALLRARDAGSGGGGLRLSATAGHLLMELTSPDSTPAPVTWLDAAYLAGADAAGRHHTFGETRDRQVHWATVALPAPRLAPGTGTATHPATGAAADADADADAADGVKGPAAEPGDDWA